jgi:NADPH:quinone reductase-like Zn-dependent oxidoreductase
VPRHGRWSAARRPPSRSALGADVVLVDGDDLAARAATALPAGASLRVLFEGTGDPTEVAKLVGLVEESGSVVACASATGQAATIPLADLIYRGISLRPFYILRWRVGRQHRQGPVCSAMRGPKTPAGRLRRSLSRWTAMKEGLLGGTLSVFRAAPPGCPRA